MPDWVGAYATYQQTQLQVFVGGLDDLFLIAAGLSALGALGALLLRSGPAPATPASLAVPRQVTTPTAPTNGGPVKDVAVANGAVMGLANPEALPAALTGEMRPGRGEVAGHARLDP